MTNSITAPPTAPASHPGHPLRPIARCRFLALDDPSAADLSQDLAQEIFWLSPRPPAELAGALVDDYQGAWIEPKRLVVRLAGAECAYQLPDLTHTDTASLMQAVLIRHLQGHSHEAIQRDLTASDLDLFSLLS